MLGLGLMIMGPLAVLCWDQPQTEESEWPGCAYSRWWKTHFKIVGAEILGTALVLSSSALQILELGALVCSVNSGRDTYVGDDHDTAHVYVEICLSVQPVHTAGMFSFKRQCRARGDPGESSEWNRLACSAPALYPLPRSDRCGAVGDRPLDTPSSTAHHKRNMPRDRAPDV